MGTFGAMTLLEESLDAGELGTPSLSSAQHKPTTGGRVTPNKSCQAGQEREVQPPKRIVDSP